MKAVRLSDLRNGLVPDNAYEILRGADALSAPNPQLLGRLGFKFVPDHRLVLLLQLRQREFWTADRSENASAGYGIMLQALRHQSFGAFHRPFWWKGQ